MGVPVVVMGRSGAGKTYSLKNFKPEEIGIFSVRKKNLPFRKNGLENVVAERATYEMINAVFSKPLNKKAYAIDDSQFLMSDEMGARANETGYKKFTDIAVKFNNLVSLISYNLPDDVIVYFLHHTETDSNTGEVKMKTVGKMLDSQFTIEGCFDIVLLAKTENGEHFFETQSDGFSTAKSPEGMFAELKIPNDLKAVDTAIREYYGFPAGGEK